MYAATSETLQTPLIGAPITFTDTQVDADDFIAHAPGSGIFTLLKRGIYVVSFNVTASSSGETFPINPAIHLDLNGVAVPGSFVEAQLASTADRDPMSFVVAFCVSTTPVNLSVLSTAGGVSFNHASIVITKVGDARDCGLLGITV